MKKREGQVGIFVSMYMFLFLLVLITYQIQIYQYDAVKIRTEDALAASNLASAVVDLEEYGITHNIIIEDPDTAYALYQEALKINMDLNSEWKSNYTSVITGPVQVVDYIIYNVHGSDIEIYSYGDNAYTTVVKDGLGSVASPNNHLIESTSVYSKITFPVSGIFNIETTAVKEKLVDIVKNSEE